MSDAQFGLLVLVAIVAMFFGKDLYFKGYGFRGQASTPPGVWPQQLPPQDTPPVQTRRVKRAGKRQTRRKPNQTQDDKPEPE